MESSLQLIFLGPRFAEYDVFTNNVFDRERAKALAGTAEGHWEAILERDLVRLGVTMREGFNAPVALFPNMMNERVAALIAEYRDQAFGWKLSGAGGGACLILVAEKPIPGAIRVIARREMN